MATSGDKSIIPINGMTLRKGRTSGAVRLFTSGATGLPRGIANPA